MFKFHGNKSQSRQNTSGSNYWYAVRYTPHHSIISTSSTSSWNSISSGSSLHDHSVSYSSDRSLIPSASSKLSMSGLMTKTATAMEGPSFKTMTMPGQPQNQASRFNSTLVVNAASFRNGSSVGNAISALASNSFYSRNNPFTETIKYRDYQQLPNIFPAAKDRGRAADMEQDIVRGILARREQKEMQMQKLLEQFSRAKKADSHQREYTKKASEIKEPGPSEAEKKEMRKKTDEDKLGHMEWTEDGYSFRKYVPSLRKVEPVGGTIPISQKNRKKGRQRKKETRNQNVLKTCQPESTEKNKHQKSENERKATPNTETINSEEKEAPTSENKIQAKKLNKHMDSSKQAVCKKTTEKKPNIFRRLFGGADRPVAQNDDITQLVAQWHQQGPIIGEGETGFGLEVSSHFFISPADVTFMRTPETMVTSAGVWHPLFHETGTFNINTQPEYQFSLVHPDFFINYYGGDQPDTRPIADVLPEFVAFPNNEVPHRVLMPVRLVNFPHFVLVAMGLDRRDQIRVHVMDSLQCELPSIPHSQLMEVARYFYGSTREITIEQGTIDEVEQQDPTSNDCGVFTILNGIRYLQSRHNRFRSMRKSMKLDRSEETNTCKLRRKYARYLERIRSNADINMFGILADLDQPPADAPDYGPICTTPSTKKHNALEKAREEVLKSEDVSLNTSPLANTTEHAIPICSTPKSKRKQKVDVDPYNTPISVLFAAEKTKSIEREVKRIEGLRIASGSASSFVTPGMKRIRSAPSTCIPSPGLSADFAKMDIFGTPTVPRNSSEISAHMKSLAESRWRKTKMIRSPFEFDSKKMADLEYLRERLRNLDEFIKGEIELILKQIKDQLFLDVDGPPNMSEEERKKRQLCKLPIHMCPESTSNEERRIFYRPVKEIFERANCLFLGLNDPIDVKNDAKKQESFELAETIFQLDVDNEDDNLDHNSQPSTFALVFEEEGEMKVDANDFDMSTEKRSFEEGICEDEVLDDGKIPKEEDCVSSFCQNMDIQDFFIDVYGDAVQQDIPIDDEYNQALLCQITLARLCDSSCPKVDIQEAASIRDQLTSSLKACIKQINEVTYNWQEQGNLIVDWIKKYMNCYQGLRSLKRRFDYLERLAKVSSDCHELIQTNDLELMRSFLTLEHLPAIIRMKFFELHAQRKSDEHHRQSHVENTYGELSAAFNEAMLQVEIKVCDVCQSLKPPKYMSKIRKDKCFDKIIAIDPKFASKMEIDICAMCRKSKGMPGAAEANNFMPQQVPKELECLNSLELILIQKYRPNMKTFILKTVSNQATSMKGTKGVLSVLPTEINSKSGQYRETLPSGSNLTIEIRPPWGEKSIVSMPKLVAALEWLKANHQYYHDVVIDGNFSFTLGENVFFTEPGATQEDANRLVFRDSGEFDDVENNTVMEEQPIQRVHQKRDNQLAHLKYIEDTKSQNPVSVKTRDLDVMVFPQLHPYGDDGLNAPRVKSTKVAKYVRTRLLHIDRRWATNDGYICYMYGRKQQVYISTVQGIQARILYGTKRNEIDLDNENDQKRMVSIYAKCRGYPQYWSTVKSELRSHVAVFGTPTWFLTLNPNVKGWTDLHELYSKITGISVNDMNIEGLIARDPVIFARYWKLRVNSFWQEVLLDKNGPLGKIIHHFYRVEYQHKGTQHVHCILWTAEKPSTPAEIEIFLDQYVTARLPNEKEEKELYELVINHQRHWKEHTNTCTRMWKISSRWTSKRCRFGFPRPEIRQTFVYGDDTQRCNVPGVANRSYFLTRNEEETHINDYNPAILSIWKANTDVQFISTDATDIINYVTSYTTKGEKIRRMAQNNLNKYAFKSDTRSNFLLKIGLDMANQREAGILEICDDLLGHPNYGFDMAHVYVPNDAKETRMRVLKPMKDIQGDDDVMHEMSWLDSYYPNRPESLEQHSLYNIMVNFHIVGTASDQMKKKRSSLKKKNEKPSVGDEDNEDDNEEASYTKKTVGEDRFNINEPRSPFYWHPDILIGETLAIPNTDGKFLRKRKQHVPRFYIPQLVYENVEMVEDYYRRLVIVLVPWRNEDTILEEYGVKTYSDVWIKFLDREKKANKAAHSDIQKLWDGYTCLQNQEADMNKRIEQIRRGIASLRANKANKKEEENFEIHSRKVDIAKHEANKLKLNEEQRSIFEYVIERIKKQQKVKKRNNRIQRENKKLIKEKQQPMPLHPDVDPVQMFVSGVAGTGKSVLIKVLADEITLLYSKKSDEIRPPVLLNGPTGVIAVAMDGVTIHGLYGIRVIQEDDFDEDKFQQLSSRVFDLKKFLFSNALLGITDEISMVSNVMFVKMNRRSQEISGKNLPFGGYNIILFGDLMQLPPVSGRPVFEKLRIPVARRIFGTIDAGVDLWKSLEYKELTQNMRQRKHLDLAKMFERIRTGIQTREDIRVLESRRIPAENPADPTMNEIADAYIHIIQKDPHAMALFPTNAEVSEFNSSVLKRFELDNPITFHAKDTLATRQLTYKKKNRKTNQLRSWQKSENKFKKHRFHSKNINKNDSKSHEHDIQGGLPAKLTVAVGARVMLRRNISIRDRLVNGATGVVTKIERNTSSGDIDQIFVHFDDFETPTGISKEFAKFSQLGDIMIRTQFPLIVSYGATIHKAQGLTLRNVLVRPQKIYAAGSFYVAITRVTKLKGLHLAGFDEKVIKYDSNALLECNRLRATLGLEELEAGRGSGASSIKPIELKTGEDREKINVKESPPVSEPEPIEEPMASPPAKRKAKSTIFETITSSIGSLFDVKKSEKSKSSKAMRWVKPGKKIHIETTLAYLSLPNDENVELSSALNLLFGCTVFRDLITNFRGYKGPSTSSSTVTDCIISIFMRYVQTTVKLQKQMEGINGQEKMEAGTVLEQLILRIHMDIATAVDENAANEMLRSISYCVDRKKICDSCQHEKPKGVRDGIQRVFHVPLNENMTFEECVKEASTGKARICRNCGELEWRKIKHLKTRKHLIVLIDKVPETPVCYLKNFERDAIFDLFGSKWNLRTYSEQDNTTWIRMEDGNWMCVNGRTTNSKRNNRPSDIRVMIIEKIRKVQ